MESFPRFYDEISERYDLEDSFDAARLEEQAFLKAKIARGTATPADIARLMNIIMMEN